MELGKVKSLLTAVGNIVDVAVSSVELAETTIENSNLGEWLMSGLRDAAGSVENATAGPVVVAGSIGAAKATVAALLGPAVAVPPRPTTEQCATAAEHFVAASEFAHPNSY